MTEITQLIKKARQDRDKAKDALDKAEYLLGALLEATGQTDANTDKKTKIDAFDKFNEAAPRNKFANKDQVKLSELGVIEPPAISFLTHVESAVKKFGEQEFMVIHVEAILQDMGEMPTGKSPRAKIASTLTKLVKKNIIVKTHAGQGNDPNRYILKEHTIFAMKDDKPHETTKPKTSKTDLGLVSGS